MASWAGGKGWDGAGKGKSGSKDWNTGGAKGWVPTKAWDFGKAGDSGKAGGKAGGKDGGWGGGKDGGKSWGGGKSWDNGKGWDGGKGKGGYDGGKSWGKGKDGKGKDGKGKGKGKRPSGPGLPRTRITEEPVTGEVLEWKGKYGWIQPTVPVEHELAQRREGKIYVSMSDLVGGVEELTVGSLCQFHVFTDPSGLGAEECLGS
uniref:Uncharacterized protein n=1 Tax=Zooxanthella nutricula TaxID=1333877 RepID=A0A7S2QGQ7_9DINO